MKIGVDYYPEQWNPELWEQDAEQMRSAGVSIVRLAEFAWSRLEPAEGVYDFEWLDRIIRIFQEKEIEIFLCTPTCTPPQWLFRKYPEVIQVGRDGNRIATGIRGHRCMNSPVYREFSEKIITQMVSRYRGWKGVIGYQIDNELESSQCCCPICADRFREWVRKRYGTIEQVNVAYGNSVWSGEYSDFEEIQPPFGMFPKWLNPSYMLDFNRYASDSTVEYVRFQAELIRRLDPAVKITTNNWLCENMPDFYKMFEGLDFVSYDNYPVTKLPEDPQTLYSHAFHLDLMRGIRQENFWIMEQLSGVVGSWMPMGRLPQPGMLKGYSLQAIAHGADAVLHFRWRTAVSGAEMYWHGILDHSNVPGRRYQEFEELCREVSALQELDGSVTQNRVAVLYSSEQEYAFKLQHQSEGIYYFEQLKFLHDAFTCLGIGVDIINWREDISSYDIVAAPNLMIVDAVVTEQLYHFAEKGGVVILTNRSGVKEENNQCIMSQLPTVFSDLAGVRVTEYDPLGNDWQKLMIQDAAWKTDLEHWKQRLGKTDSPVGETECTRWCDLLETTTAEVLAQYDENFYRGTAAVTRNQYGNGEAYYLGTVLTREAYIALAEKILQGRGMLYQRELPLGIEITQRKGNGKCWSFLFNNTDHVQQVHFNKTDMLEEEIEVFEPFEMKIKTKP